MKKSLPGRDATILATLSRLHTTFEVCVKNNKIFMVHVSVAGSVFVKELNFFKSQGGFREKWGKAWFPIVANSIEDARSKAK